MIVELCQTKGYLQHYSHKINSAVSHCFFLFCKALFRRWSYRKGEKQTHLFAVSLKWPLCLGLCPSQQPGISFLSPICSRGLSSQAIFRCLPRHVSRVLNQKWSSWDLSQNSWAAAVAREGDLICCATTPTTLIVCKFFFQTCLGKRMAW